MYEYRALVTKVVDGDTIDVQIDLGFKVWSNQRLRLAGIDTPEIRTRDKEEKEAGLAAKKAVTDMLLGKFVHIKTNKAGKYGRYLAEIFLDDLNINEYLLQEGYAKVYK